MNPKPFEDVNWAEVFPAPKKGFHRSGKFSVPVTPLPWLLSFEDNLHRTAEWLLRNGRRPEYQQEKELYLTPIRENWYHMDRDPGKLLHICFPTDLIRFRSDYGVIYEQFVDLDFTKMSTHVITMKKRLSELLWTQWKCMGGDGYYDEDSEVERQRWLQNAHGEPQQRKYKWTCHRCQEAMPRGVKIYVQMTYGKLKDV
jgi:hypothetical protein